MWTIIVLAICMVIPPVVVAIYGKPLNVLLNVVLTAFGIIPGVAHAIFIFIDRKHSGKYSDVKKEEVKSG